MPCVKISLMSYYLDNIGQDYKYISYFAKNNILWVPIRNASVKHF